jgi:hypothetical protein
MQPVILRSAGNGHGENKTDQGNQTKAEQISSMQWAREAPRGIYQV